MDQVIYYFYKTDKHMKEYAPKLNNTDIVSPECYQATQIIEYDKVDQDLLDSRAGDDYYSYD